LWQKFLHPIIKKLKNAIEKAKAYVKIRMNLLTLMVRVFVLVRG